ncbi:hypothetical protein BT96DRAFT_503385 [Gymnopus androsaceus JB14]|uniref:Uncharacterized protein n=1 Tax=Gymnopus androsaceus JB14 TaxID=1447944 RepID=A0A6A4HYG9_9AGAR|nr:hypothetical protein BT96DRAFT_503385 [Gymnopus androsaceus JB14]
MNLSQINLENFAVDQQLLAALQHHPVTTVFLGTLGDNSLMKAVEELLPMYHLETCRKWLLNALSFYSDATIDAHPKSGRWHLSVVLQCTA